MCTVCSASTQTWADGTHTHGLRVAWSVSMGQHVVAVIHTAVAMPSQCRFGDLVALDMGRPTGRYNLNLSRTVDRLVALRLQIASALEAAWHDNK
jgi:hypothetical protein